MGQCAVNRCKGHIHEGNRSKNVYRSKHSTDFRQKKPAQVMRGLESTEVVEETDFTIHGLLRRTKSLDG